MCLPIANRTNAGPKEPQWDRLAKKKAPAIARKGLIRLDFLAPRPGLEPGTYGLTAQVTPVLIAHKVKKFKEFSAGQGAEFSMPNYQPNLWRR
jgi:hypothetical protein